MTCIPRLCAVVTVLTLVLCGVAIAQPLDTDADGIPDEIERRLGTDPLFAEELELIAQAPGPEVDQSQDELGQIKKLITGYASSITPYALEDQMRDLAANHREEGLRAFEEVLGHADDYPEWVVMQDVLSAMAKFFGHEEPERIYRNWLFHTDSKHAISDFRTRGVSLAWRDDTGWARQLFEEAAREADSEAARYALINALDIELTGKELEAYLRSDEGLYDAVQTALGQASVAVHNLAAGRHELGGGRPAEVLEAMHNVLTYHGEYYDIFHLHRAMFLWFLDRDAEALPDLDAYIALHPEFPYAHHLRARILAELGDTEGARAAEDMYQAKNEAMESLSIELPELPDELPETDLKCHDPSWQEFLEDPDPVLLAEAVASSNADPNTRGAAVQALRERFRPEELGEAVPWLELAIVRRLLDYSSFVSAALLLGEIGCPISAPVIADLAVDEMWGNSSPSMRVIRAFQPFPREIAKPHLLWVATQTRSRVCFYLADDLYEPERKYWRASWELIAGGRLEDRLAAAAAMGTYDFLTSLTLYEMATDPNLDAAMRADALEALRKLPSHPLADLVE